MSSKSLAGEFNSSNGIINYGNAVELEYCYDEEELISSKIETSSHPVVKVNNELANNVSVHLLNIAIDEDYDVNLLSKIGQNDDEEFYIEMDNDYLFRLNSNASSRDIKTKVCGNL